MCSTSCHGDCGSVVCSTLGHGECNLRCAAHLAVANVVGHMVMTEAYEAVPL